MALLQYFRRVTKKELPSSEDPLSSTAHSWNLPRYMPNHRFVFDYCHSVAIHSVASLSPALQFFSDSCLPYRFVDVEASNTSLHLKSRHRQMLHVITWPTCEVQRSSFTVTKGLIFCGTFCCAKIKPANNYCNTTVMASAKIKLRE